MLRYPVFFIHGAGFRDRKHLGYWGRIPKELEKRGIKVAYGNQDSWGTIEGNAAVLRENLQKYIDETGCGKVNIIAHSKGGIEARRLACDPDCAELIASVTTVSTPHHGSKTMDMLLKLPKLLFKAVSVAANLWFRLLGDKNPDFKTACEQFTTVYMEKFNREHPDTDGIYYQSCATVMRSPRSDMFMLLPSFVVGLIEGENDGLVAVNSAQWTNFNGVWKSATGRGISHVDVIDLRRRRLSKKTDKEGITDICDCYLALIDGLRERGF